MEIRRECKEFFGKKDIVISLCFEVAYEQRTGKMLGEEDVVYFAFVSTV
jgi:hypothetical protein